jgi:hypothetical protein
VVLFPKIFIALSLGLVYNPQFETGRTLSKLAEVSDDGPSKTAVLFVVLQQRSCLPLDQLVGGLLHILAFDRKLSGLSLGMRGIVR